MQPAQVLKVAVHGVPKLLDYLPPPQVDIGDCTPGTRALITVGSRSRTGLIVRHGTTSLPAAKVKACVAIVDTQPLLDAALLRLVCWCSEYYLCNLGTAIHTALPKGIHQQGAQPAGVGWVLTDPPPATRLSKAQQRLLAVFQHHNGRLYQHQLMDTAPITTSKLAEAGYIRPLAVDEISHDNQVINPDILLNQAQHDAVTQILATRGYRCTLLYGVTGSGKTQVYLELVKRVIQQGKQALLLVPEIGLTPQTLARFTHHFGDVIGVIHSGIKDRERAATWQGIQSGVIRLVIGTRSAIWSPFRLLGLIVVDEEHDGSFKQHSELRYNARDLSLVRGQQADCPVVLGSATPLISSLHKAAKEQFALIRLTRRATGVAMPNIAMVDMRDSPPRQYLAPQSIVAITQQLADHKQVLIFLNRRGFAPLLHCQTCGWQAMCNQCDSRMTLHQQPAGLLCHHCGLRQPVPRQCPGCGQHRLHTFGSGTQHISGYLQKTFPDTRILRIDRDSVGNKGSLQQLLQQLHNQQSVILVGTQMLAKGHDFARLGLVVVVEADNGLFSSDFRAPEVTLQLLIQVAGRAGRNTERCRVLIQTTQPDAHYFRYLQRNDYDSLAATLLKERKRYRLPPWHSLVMLRASHSNQQRVQQFAAQAIHTLRQLASTDPHLHTLGPAPPAIGRMAGLWREQILVLHPSRTRLHQLCTQWRDRLHSITPVCNWYFDVDPYEVL